VVVVCQRSKCPTPSDRTVRVEGDHPPEGGWGATMPNKPQAHDHNHSSRPQAPPEPFGARSRVIAVVRARGLLCRSP
jgi:hypothetical protein